MFNATEAWKGTQRAILLTRGARATLNSLDYTSTNASVKMPPIKRTKFKLNTDELMEMYYWLKLIRAFDERLSLAGAAGQGAQRRLYRHRPGSDHRRHLFRPAARKTTFARSIAISARS